MYGIALVAVALLGLLNLVFILGVIRRLREHFQHLKRLLAAPASGSAEQPLAPGTTVPDLRELIGNDSDQGPVGCEALIPEFAERAGRFSRGRALAVLAITTTTTPRPTGACSNRSPGWSSSSTAAPTRRSSPAA